MTIHPLHSCNAVLERFAHSLEFSLTRRFSLGRLVPSLDVGLRFVHEKLQMIAKTDGRRR